MAARKYFRNGNYLLCQNDEENKCSTINKNINTFSTPPFPIMGDRISHWNYCVTNYGACYDWNYIFDLKVKGVFFKQSSGGVSVIREWVDWWLYLCIASSLINCTYVPQFRSSLQFIYIFKRLSLIAHMFHNYSVEQVKMGRGVFLGKGKAVDLGLFNVTQNITYSFWECGPVKPNYSITVCFVQSL